MLSATKKEQKAKDSLLKAQRSEEAAKNDKEISFAQAGTQKAQKTLENAEKEKKRLASSLEVISGDLAKKRQASENADKALVQAQDTLKMAENREHNWDKLVKQSKDHAAKEMADYDEAQEARSTLLKSQKAEYEGKLKIAIEKQKEAYSRVSEATEAAKRSSEEADRLRVEKNSAAQVATSSIALAESSGSKVTTSKTGVSLVQSTVPKGPSAVQVLKKALSEHLFADVENVQKVNKRSFVQEGKLEIDDVAAAKLSMVTSDEKVSGLVQLLEDTLGKDSATPADVTVTEFTSGNQQYLDWVKEQTNLPAG